MSTSFAETQKELREGAMVTTIKPGLNFKLKGIEKLVFLEGSQIFHFEFGEPFQGSCDVYRKKNADGSRLKKAIYENAENFELTVKNVDYRISETLEYGAKDPQFVEIEINNSKVIEKIKCQGMSTISDFRKAFSLDIVQQYQFLPFDDVIVEDLSGPNIEDAAKAYSNHI